MADARDLKSRGSDPVPVRSRSPAPYRGVEQLVARRAHNPEVAGSSPASATKKKDICFQQMSFFCVQTPGAGRAALLNRPAGIARFQRVFRFSSPFRGGRPLPQPGSSPRRKPISSRRRAMNRPSISDSVSPARRITPISMVKLGMGTEWIPIWSFRSGGRATPTL